MTPRDPQRILEELLVLRAQDGDESAWQDLVRSWNARLFAHAVTLLANRSAAQDAVQEAWLAALRGIRRLEDPARFRPWIMRIVSNKCADIIRGAQRQRTANQKIAEDADGTIDAKLPASEEDPIEALRLGLRQLPPDRRALLTMLYLRSMTVAEIAVVLDIPNGTVKSRLHHAREHLRSILNQTAIPTTTLQNQQGENNERT